MCLWLKFTLYIKHLPICGVTDQEAPKAFIHHCAGRHFINNWCYELSPNMLHGILNTSILLWRVLHSNFCAASNIPLCNVKLFKLGLQFLYLSKSDFWFSKSRLSMVADNDLAHTYSAWIKNGLPCFKILLTRCSAYIWASFLICVQCKKHWSKSSY